MKITYKLLKEHHACEEQASKFKLMFPNGCEPTIDNLSALQAENLSVFWLTRLLPSEGLNSQRHFALLCAQEVAHFNKDPRIQQTLDVVRRKVENPLSVSDKELATAYAAAWAARAAAAAAAWAAWAAYADAATAYADARAAADAAADAAAAAAWAAAADADAAWAADAAAAWAAAADAAAETNKQLAFLSAMLLETGSK